MRGPGPAALARASVGSANSRAARGSARIGSLRLTGPAYSPLVDAPYSAVSLAPKSKTSYEMYYFALAR